MIRLMRLWRLAGRDFGLLWFALKHPHRPIWLIPVVLALGIYALEPLNFAIPVLGILDDMVLLPLLLHGILKLLPAEIRAAADAPYESR